MLAIRMQRIGRRGHAMYRVIVQGARLSPASGNVVALVGNYDPHAKTVSLDKKLIGSYLEKGAQPSERVAKLLKAEGMKLPGWVEKAPKKSGKIRHPEKLRRNRPQEKQPVANSETAAEAPVAEVPAEEPAVAETPAEIEKKQ